MHGVIFLAAAAVVLVFSHGHFGENQVWAMTAAVVAFTAASAVRSPKEGALPPRSGDVLLAGTVFLFTVFLARQTEMLYAELSERLLALGTMLRFLPCVAGVALAFAGARAPGARALTAVAALLVIVALSWSRHEVLAVSPAPHIDVWTSSQKAVHYFLVDHVNPYAQSYEDIYKGKYDYPPGFPYWPGYLLWASAWDYIALQFGAAALDVRHSLLAAEALVVAAIAGWMRRGDRPVPWSTVLLVGAAWTTVPIALFVLEQAWIDPLLVLCVVLAAWALSSRRAFLAGLALGFACGTKQYAIVASGLAFVHVLRARGLRAAMRFTAGGAVAFFGLLLPFVLANPTQFYNRSIRTVADLQPRTDALSIPAFFSYQRPPEDVPKIFHEATLASLVLLAAILAWQALRKDRGVAAWLEASVAAYGVVFLLGKQAFCNYYYFLAFFALAVSIARTVSPRET